MNPYPDYKLGIIEEQAFTDLIVVDSNPLDDIACLKHDKIKVGCAKGWQVLQVHFGRWCAGGGQEVR